MKMQLKDLIRYIVKNYPKKEDLSKARVNKLVYLIDWKSALDYNEQISDIDWIFNHYGPYVDSIETEISSDDRFRIKKTINFYGNEKNIIGLQKDEGFKEPNEKQKKIIDLVIDITNNMNWSNFINTVYSTYPIKHSERGENLDLVKLASEYKMQKDN